MLSRTLRIAAVLLLAFSIVSCVGPAPTAPGPLPASPSPTEAGESDASHVAPTAPADLTTTVADPAAAVPAPEASPELEAVLIFSQPPNPDGGLIPSSCASRRAAARTSGPGRISTFDTVQTITEVRWRGAYDPARRGSGGPVRDFTIDIYPSIPMGSEPDVATGPLIHYEVRGNANETAAEMVGDVQMYDYSFALPDPLRGRCLHALLGPDRGAARTAIRTGRFPKAPGATRSTSEESWATAPTSTSMLPAMRLSTCWRWVSAGETPGEAGPHCAAEGGLDRDRSRRPK